MKPLSFASLEHRRGKTHPLIRQNETFKFVQLILSTTLSSSSIIHKCTHNVPPTRREVARNYEPPIKDGGREGLFAKKRAPIHRWMVRRSKGINEETGQSRDPIWKRGRGAARRGEWNELEEEKRGKKKWRRVEWTIDFLIKGKLFQKVGTKSASIPGIDTDGGKFGLVASALVGSLA